LFGVRSSALQETAKVPTLAPIVTGIKADDLSARAEKRDRSKYSKGIGSTLATGKRSESAHYYSATRKIVARTTYKENVNGADLVVWVLNQIERPEPFTGTSYWPS
jgi:hypothetical protein